jgi:FemAB-related protein (PEP-CTERM system-associated)
MASTIEVGPGSPRDDAPRDALVAAHPRGTVFHLSAWRDVVQEVYGHPSHELLAWRDGALVGVLPLMEFRSLRGRRQLLSTPYAVYGGPLGADVEVEQALLSAAMRAAERLGVGYLELRYVDAPANDLRESDLYATFVRDLPSDPASVLARMPKKARADARKGREQGLELAEGQWYVDDLHRLFLRNKHGLGSPGLPLRHFHAILSRLGARTHVHLVRAGRSPVAAVMSFGFRDTLIAYYAGTAPGADRTAKASNFMYMALQEWAVERGFKRFDFCRSRKDSGPYQFKKHQGFEPRPLHYRFHLVKDAQLPSFTPSNPRTRLLRTAWSRLPLWVAGRISDSVAAYLP